MSKNPLKDSLGWGLALWLIGYGLGIILFPLVPVAMIGWVIMPIGLIITLYVLFRRVSAGPLKRYLIISIVWTIIAIACDYLFLVQLLKPADGYYKLDVYLYYALTFLLPLLVGWRKNKIHANT